MAEEPPTTWELFRAINALRESVDKLAAGAVTQATLAIMQQAQKDKDDRQDARIKQLEQDQEDQRKERARQWFAIVMAIVSGIVSLGVAFIVKGTPS